jgi:hypothetical protein
MTIKEKPEKCLNSAPYDNQQGAVMESVSTLYHGSIHLFDKIDVSCGKPFKDFGMGFYASPGAEHSENLALRNKAIEEARIKKQEALPAVSAWLYEYEFYGRNRENLNVKEFENADKEWMRFVVQNRASGTRIHHYDVVIGPTANDNTRVAIRAFFAGAYGDVQSDTAMDTLISLIEPAKLPTQFYFGSEKAAAMLTLKRRREVK